MSRATALKEHCICFATISSVASILFFVGQSLASVFTNYSEEKIQWFAFDQARHVNVLSELYWLGAGVTL